MAAPASVTISSLTGRWHLNKTLSDSQQSMLQHLGMPFLARKTMAYASISIDVNQYVDIDNLVHIDSKQSAMGRVASIEPRTADWTHREQQNPYLGNITGRCRMIPSAGRTDDWEDLDGWLKEQWGESQDLFQSAVTSLERGWVWTQIWGFAEIEGQRYHVRRLWFKKDHVVDRCRLVYDWDDSIDRQ